MTVRFETPYAAVPGRVRTFRVDDPELESADPLPLVEGAEVQVGSSSAPATLPNVTSGD